MSCACPALTAPLRVAHPDLLLHSPTELASLPYSQLDNLLDQRDVADAAALQQQLEDEKRQRAAIRKAKRRERCCGCLHAGTKAQRLVIGGFAAGIAIFLAVFFVSSGLISAICWWTSCGLLATDPSFAPG